MTASAKKRFYCEALSWAYISSSEGGVLGNAKRSTAAPYPFSSALYLACISDLLSFWYSLCIKESQKNTPTLIFSFKAPFKGILSQGPFLWKKNESYQTCSKEDQKGAFFYHHLLVVRVSGEINVFCQKVCLPTGTSKTMDLVGKPRITNTRWISSSLIPTLFQVSIQHRL